MICTSTEFTSLWIFVGLFSYIYICTSLSIYILGFPVHMRRSLSTYLGLFSCMYVCLVLYILVFFMKCLVVVGRDTHAKQYQGLFLYIHIYIWIMCISFWWFVGLFWGIWRSSDTTHISREYQGLFLCVYICIYIYYVHVCLVICRSLLRYLAVLGHDPHIETVSKSLSIYMYICLYFMCRSFLLFVGFFWDIWQSSDTTHISKQYQDLFLCIYIYTYILCIYIYIYILCACLFGYLQFFLRYLMAVLWHDTHVSTVARSLSIIRVFSYKIGLFAYL